MHLEASGSIFKSSGGIWEASGLLDQVRTPYAKPHTGFIFRLGQTLVATLSAHDLRERNSSGVSSCSKMCSSLSAVLAMPGVQM